MLKICCPLACVAASAAAIFGAYIGRYELSAVNIALATVNFYLSLVAWGVGRSVHR